MHIAVAETAQTLATLSVKGKVLVVLDIFRATSTMITALANGSQVILPVSSVEEASKLKICHPRALLGGERRGERIRGFDLGNSPLEYGKEIMRHRPLIFLSTNGTKAILAAKEANRVYLASFLNALAAAEQLRTVDNLLLSCAGTQGTSSLEDTCCAGYLIHLLQKMCKTKLSDSSLAALALYKSYQGNLLEYLSQSRNGRALAAKGRQDDIQYCCIRNILTLVPEFIPQEGIQPLPFEERRNCTL